MNVIENLTGLCLGLCFCPTLLLAAELGAPDPFAGAPYRLWNARTGRVSSWDRTGDNRDFLSFQAGETKELLSLDGPGVLTHLYLTPAASPAALRALVLRAFWDDEPSPSVEVPLGDFFCADWSETGRPSRSPFALGVEYMSPGLAEIYARTGVQWAKAMGAGFAWGDVEPKPPVNGKHTYNWHYTDRLLLEYQRAGFRHFQLYTKARCSWASSKPLPPLSHGSFPPKAEFMRDYADYLRNLVERYDKDGYEDAPGLLYPVLYYEIEAEWGTFWLGTTEEYLELLKVAHAAVKSAHPQAQVILIGFFLAGVFEGNPDPDVERAIREHLPPYQQAKVRQGMAEADKLLSHPDLFDVVEFHSLSDWTEIVGMTRFLREKMRQHGYEKPIWVGDVNYTASPMLFWGLPVPPYTRAQKPALEETARVLANPRHPRHGQVEAWFRAEQACGLVKKAVLAMGEGCAGINLGNLEDWDIFAFVPTITGTAAFHGLVDRKGWVGRPKADAARIPGEPRPAYQALALVAQKLSGFTAVKRLSLGQGVYAYTFTVNSREVTVLWYDDGKRYLPGEVPPSRRVELPAPPQPHRLWLTPTERHVPAPPARRLTPAQGKLTLELGPVPVFLESTEHGAQSTGHGARRTDSGPCALCPALLCPMPCAGEGTDQAGLYVRRVETPSQPVPR